MSADPGVVEVDRGGGPSMGMAGGGATVGGGGAAEGVVAAADAPPEPAELVAMTHFSPPLRGRRGLA